MTKLDEIIVTILFGLCATLLSQALLSDNVIRVFICLSLSVLIILYIIFLAKRNRWDSRVLGIASSTEHLSQSRIIIKKRSSNSKANNVALTFLENVVNAIVDLLDWALISSLKNVFIAVIIALVLNFLAFCVNLFPPSKVSHENNAEEGNALVAEIDGTTTNFFKLNSYYEDVFIEGIWDRQIVAVFLSESTENSDKYRLKLRISQNNNQGNLVEWTPDHNDNISLNSLELSNDSQNLEYTGSDLCAKKSWYHIEISPSAAVNSYAGHLSADVQLHYGSIYTDEVIRIRECCFDFTIDV